MDRMWRLLVAVFLLIVGIALGLMSWLFGDSVVGVICLYGGLILVPIGIIKGFFNIFFYDPNDVKKVE